MLLDLITSRQSDTKLIFTQQYLLTTTVLQQLSSSEERLVAFDCATDSQNLKDARHLLTLWHDSLKLSGQLDLICGAAQDQTFWKALSAVGRRLIDGVWASGFVPPRLKSLIRLVTNC